MSVLYFINGDRASATEAKRFLSAEAEIHGYSEFLGEITGYQLEIEVQ